MSVAAFSKLDRIGVDAYCEAIVGGMTMSAFAAKVGVSRFTLMRWLAADPDRATLSKEARKMSAAAFDDLAEKEIADAKSPFDLAKARELAQHYRWRAAKIDPGEYAERRELTGKDGSPLLPLDPEWSEERRQLEGARRVAFVLARGAQIAERMTARASATST